MTDEWLHLQTDPPKQQIGNTRKPEKFHKTKKLQGQKKTESFKEKGAFVNSCFVSRNFYIR